jgi:cobalt-zinc-cadmium efflux system membrane fusion protein
MNKIFYSLLFSILFLSCKNEVIEEIVTPDDGIITITKEQFSSSGMEIASLTEYDFDITVKATGKVDVPPQNRAKVTTFLGGYVKSTKLMVGDKVTKGQALVTLENSEYIDIQKDYLEVAEQITYLKSEYERQKTLFEEKITSQKNYLKAESDYRRAKGLYQGLREKLQLLNINPAQVERGNFTSTITVFAPISGDISVMNANIGMFLTPSDVILEIVDANFLQLELTVFEKDIMQIKKDQIIQFSFPEASDVVYESKVFLVGKSIEGNDRTIKVYGNLEDSIKQKLLSGMFVEAAINVSSKKGLAVPKEAVFVENNQHFVFIVENDQKDYLFKKENVILGEQSETSIEIIPNKKVHAATKILAKGVFDITN